MGCCGPGKGGSGDGGKGMDLRSPQGQQGVLMGWLWGMKKEEGSGLSSIWGNSGATYRYGKGGVRVGQGTKLLG